MSKVTGCGAIALAMILVVGACSSNGGKGGTGGAGGKGAGGITGTGGFNPGGSEERGGSSGSGMGGQAGQSDGGLGGQDAGSPDVPDGSLDSPDAITCCPTDPDPSHGGTVVNIGSVRLGGAKIGFNNCGPAFDLTCTSNWRLETDQYGCPTWHYDFDIVCCPQPDGAVYRSDACPAGSDAADSGHDAPSGN